MVETLPEVLKAWKNKYGNETISQTRGKTMEIWVKKDFYAENKLELHAFFESIGWELTCLPTKQSKSSTWGPIKEDEDGYFLIVQLNEE